MIPKERLVRSFFALAATAATVEKEVEGLPLLLLVGFRATVVGDSSGKSVRMVPGRRLLVGDAGVSLFTGASSDDSGRGLARRRGSGEVASCCRRRRCVGDSIFLESRVPFRAFF